MGEGDKEHEEKDRGHQEKYLETFNGWYSGLEFEDQMCFVFDSVPSQLDAVFWSLAYSDIQLKIKLVVGLQTVKFGQFQESLMKVAVAIMGGESEKPVTVRKQDEPQNIAQAQAMISGLS